ncbi:MAG: polyamine aminopropyltransferase [Alphaproteobacteria bacterium]|nr:polyamine aminopropyltransferase [Alphaproteobacteria bacterium]
MSAWFNETLYTAIRQSLRIDKLLFRDKSPFQEVAIFENEMMGRVLALDGIIQTSEKDEFVYHEMLTHLPMMAHGRVRRILIIGGGDGGVLREALRHKSVEKAVMVEIDGMVVEQCLRLMPSLPGKAYKDKRAELIIGDGIDYVRKSKDTFDLIVVDSTDPIGPAEVLFTDEFYRHCRRLTRGGGVVVKQTGVPIHQGPELRQAVKRLRKIFPKAGAYIAAVPLYYGGFMALTWASDRADLPATSVATVRKPWAKLGIKTKYYTPEIQYGAFALPRFIKDLVA